jgi:hypothetical protein
VALRNARRIRGDQGSAEACLSAETCLIGLGHPGMTTCHAASAECAFDAIRLIVKQYQANATLPMTTCAILTSLIERCGSLRIAATAATAWTEI